jgi:hypothetical protein
LIDPVKQAQAGILRYLAAHQDARDTIVGIENWWLPQSRAYGKADVAAALEILADKNLIQVWKSAFSGPVYGKGSADARALEDYLRTLQSS